MPRTVPARPAIPADFPVQPIDPKDAKDPATCGTCGLTWDDSEPTEYTPAPAGRCPFEAFHGDGEGDCAPVLETAEEEAAAQRKPERKPRPTRRAVVSDLPRAVPGQPLGCGHPCPTPPADSGATGYGYSCPPGQPEVSACYPCLATLQRFDMARAHAKGEPFSGVYLNREGDKLTTWDGATVASVLWSHNAGNRWAPDLLRVGARDLAGRLWTGTARPSMYARLRPVKGRTARNLGGVA